MNQNKRTNRKNDEIILNGVKVVEMNGGNENRPLLIRGRVKALRLTFKVETNRPTALNENFSETSI